MKTIFIIDDNRTNLVAAQQALDGIYRTLQMESVAKMFLMLESVMPDLILIDLDMPFIDGIEAIKMLKIASRYCNIPVVVLSSVTFNEAIKIALSIGAKDFVAKPFDRVVLLDRIARALRL